MKSIFYLNLENKNFLTQKFLSKKYIKQIKRFKPLKHIFNVDNNSEINPIAFQKGSCGSSIFLTKQKILKVNFSTTLYLKSFLSTRQKKNMNITNVVKNFYRLIHCKKFHTLFILNPGKSGYNVHTGGVRCFLPGSQVRKFKRSLFRLYNNWKIQTVLRIFLDVLLPRLKKFFFLKKLPLAEKQNLLYSFIVSKRTVFEVLFYKKSFFLKKIPLFGFAKIKIVPSFKKKNSVKRIYYWRKYTNYVVLHTDTKKKKKG